MTRRGRGRPVTTTVVAGLTVLVAAALVGCQHGPDGPGPVSEPATQSPLPPEPTLEPVPYDAPAGYPDLSPVAGRVICIDPGHGGRWPGAVAPSNRLRESDLNLAVALRRRDTLQAARAQVILTRDRDFELDASALAADLSARPIVAHNARADVFISVHHNSTAAVQSGINDLEVYYKLGDDGPSLDLGQCLTEALARWLRQDDHAKRLLPGNYKVLRESRIPAVLLESFYLTSAQSAALAAQPQMQEMEARAIAAGLARYFSLDPPRNVVVETRERDGGRLHELVVRYDGELPVDPGSLRVVVNDQPADGVGAAVGDRTVSWLFREPLPNGAHTLHLTARNTAGAALAVDTHVQVSRPAAQVRIRQFPQSPQKGSGITFLYEVEALDAFGRPVGDGSPVTLSGQAGQTEHGVARFYIGESALPGRLLAECGTAYAETAPVYGAERSATARCVSAQDGRPISMAAVWTGQGATTRTTPEGWFTVPAQLNEVRVTAQGYEVAAASLTAGHTDLRLNPIAGGALHGRRIVIDPSGGGRDPGSIGPTGFRASDAAVDVARRAAAMLREAGAVVRLTREGDEELADLQRLEVVDAARAEVVVILTYGGADTGAGASAGYYPGSSGGARFAGLLGQQFSARTYETTTYLVQQTPCPAVLLQPCTVATPEGERTARNPAARHEDARRVFNALAAHFAQ